MRDGRAILDMAFDTLAEELGAHLDKLTGEGEHGELERVLTDEYRLILNFGGRGGISGIEARPLGSVNEWYAIQKAEEMRREHASGVVVERREVMLGRWTLVQRAGGEIPTGEGAER